MICEECEINQAEKNVILDGEIKKLCSKCSLVTSGIVIEQPSQYQIDESKRMWKVKEILSRSAGIPFNPVNKKIEVSKDKAITMDDLRPANKEKKSSYLVRAEDRMKKEAAIERNDAEEIIEESKTIKDEIELIDE